jgi:hypothetical protein
MPTKRPDRGLDISQNALRVMREATGQAPKSKPPDVKNQEAAASGRLGGRKGGKARAAALSPTVRRKIARKAARARWGKG